MSEEKVKCLVAVETEVCHSQLTLSCVMESSTYLITIMFEGLDGGVWYSLFIKNLAHYSSH